MIFAHLYILALCRLRQNMLIQSDVTQRLNGIHVTMLILPIISSTSKTIPASAAISASIQSAVTTGPTSLKLLKSINLIFLIPFLSSIRCLMLLFCSYFLVL